MTAADYFIVDAHAHICDPVFDPDRKEVLERARKAGVLSIIALGENLSDAKRNLELSETFPMLRPGAGLYPTALDPFEAESLCNFIRSRRDSLVVVGEVGMDYWAVKEEAGREIQREIFGRFIDLSLELDLPLNVHSRAAGRQAVAMLLERGAKKVQLHAFDGKAASAMPAVEAGYYFSIPPSVIRSPQKQKLVRKLPLSCLLVETDSPVLGPVPGERNEPTFALVSVDAIAELKGMDRNEVIEATCRNALALFGDPIISRERGNDSFPKAAL